MSSINDETPRRSSDALRAGTIKVVAGDRAQVLLDTRRNPNTLTAALQVAFGETPLEVGQRCAVAYLDSGEGLIVARWSA